MNRLFTREKRKTRNCSSGALEDHQKICVDFQEKAPVLRIRSIAKIASPAKVKEITNIQDSEIVSSTHPICRQYSEIDSKQ